MKLASLLRSGYHSSVEGYVEPIKFIFRWYNLNGTINLKLQIALTMLA